MKFYRIENNKLITGSGKALLPCFIEFTTTMDEEGNEVFPVEMQPYLEAEAKAQAKNQVNIDYEAQVNALTEGVPEAEIKTWTKQESEARAYLADSTTLTPLIDALCEARGVDKDYLVSKIIEKSDMYAVVVGSLTGIRQKAEDEFITQA
jgi:hypothetical protein